MFSADRHEDPFLEEDDQDYGSWSDLAQADDDLKKLAVFVQSLPLSVLPLCCCADGRCRRCQVDRIVAENARPLPERTPKPRALELLDPIPF